MGKGTIIIILIIVMVARGDKPADETGPSMGRGAFGAQAGQQQQQGFAFGQSSSTCKYCHGVTHYYPEHGKNWCEGCQDFV